MNVKTPECNKLIKVSEQSQTVGAFLSWLSDEKKLTVCEIHEHDDDDCYGDKSEFRVCGLTNGEYIPASLNIEKLLAEYFDIDLNKVEKERRKILESLRTESAK